MADILKAEVTLPYTTGIPRDVSMNVFHFLIADGTWETSMLAAGLALTGFYNTFHDMGDDGDWAVSSFIANVVSREVNACQIQYYGAQDNPQVLLGEERFTLAGDVGAQGVLPLECAAVASFTATPLLTVPKGRRRGRVYIGPLTHAAYVQFDSEIGDLPFLSPLLQNALGMSSENMAGEDTEAIWAIYSPTAGQAFEVSGGWVDNELDTQRRRQLTASNRSVWGIPY